MWPWVWPGWTIGRAARTTVPAARQRLLSGGLWRCGGAIGSRRWRSRRSRRGDELLGHAFVHTVVDDHSRAAYAEIHDDETADTAIAVLRRAVSWFRTRGVVVERVISDNGSRYKSKAWRHACSELGVKPKRTRPYRPQTNGKAERFHRTMAAEWAFSRHYHSEAQRDPH